MKILSNKLIGRGLDYMVAECEIADGFITTNSQDYSLPLLSNNHLFHPYERGVTELGLQRGAQKYGRSCGSLYSPSTDWEQGGSIIERCELLSEILLMYPMNLSIYKCPIMKIIS